MHLGYFPAGITSPDRLARAQRVALYRPRGRLVRRAGATRLGDLSADLSSMIGAGSSLVNTRNPVTSMAATGASVGSAFGPIGTVVGAVVGAIGGAFMGSKRPESGVWDEYKGKHAGKAAGHEYDNQFRNTAFVGLFRLGKNTFPPRARGGYGPNDDARFLRDMIAQIATAFRDRRLTPQDANTEAIYQKVVAPWIAQWGEEPNADWRRWENQIVKDQIDAWLYDQPIIATSYTASTWAEPRVAKLAEEILAMYAPPPAPTPAPAPAPVAPVPAVIAPVPTPAIVPAPAAPPPPVAVTLPPPVVAPPPPAPAPTVPAPVPPSSAAGGATPGSAPALVTAPPASGGVALLPTPSTSDALQRTIDQLLAANATREQTFYAALDQLQRQGVAVTPAVQEQVAQQVSQSASGEWMKNPLLIGGGLLAAFLLLNRRSRRR